MELTHIDPQGNARMVDVGEKAVTHRSAVAVGRITMSRDCLELVREGRCKKGDVLTVAQIAGIMAAKRTAELIPLCHPLQLTRTELTLSLLEADSAVEAVCTVACDGKTGAEMEALTGVSVALLTVYDMCKAADRTMVIGPVRLREKHGGKSGDFYTGGEGT